MSAMKRGRRDALVLLIVLGMLSLLSLLAVTFVVFAGQSRTASIAMARRDFRETPPERLLDQAFRQVVRGTTDPQSVAWRNDILGDLYGSGTGADAPVFLMARIVDNSGVVMRDNPNRMASYTVATPYNSSSPEGPEFYSAGSNQFLKIPIAWADKTTIPVANVDIPEQSDAWNGRVVTFLSGPLSGQSLRIVRYVGQVDIVPSGGGGATLDPSRANLQYSITVDLSDLEERLSTVGYTAGLSETKTTSQWIAKGAAALLYEEFTTQLRRPYSFMVNSGVHNSHGAGIQLNGTADYASFSTGSQLANTIHDAYLANRSQSRLVNSGYALSGDTDEPYDAADYQNFFLALKQQAFGGGTPSTDDIIPSFHRPAVINYLAKLAPDFSVISNSTTEQQRFSDFLDAVQRATGRPISYRMTGWTFGPPVKNAGFSGSNGLDFKTAALGARSPQLVIDWTNLPSQAQQDKFQAWLRWLTRGPWDVDNDGDGMRDSVWVDLNFPLMTSPEGKLLKLLTAFYIEDMDGRLDLNADGNTTQSVDATSSVTMGSNKYAYSQNNAAATGQWPQGVGYGPAEISLRPLFASDTEYNSLLDGRYRSSVTPDEQPGVPNANDTRSAVLERNRQNDPLPYTTPAAKVGYPQSTFPKAVRGKTALGLDLLGNPMFVESVPNGTTTVFGEALDDPYEASVLFGNRFDRNFTFAEYQRLARLNDVDRTGTSRRLQNAASTSFDPTSAGYWDRLRSMSPRNVSLTLPRFAGTYQYPRANTGGTSTLVTRRVASFVEFVEAYVQNVKPGLISPSPLYPIPPTPPAPYFNNAALVRLFPVEFMQNQPLNLNRPLGDGQDNDNDTLIDEADEVFNGQSAVYPSATANDEYIRDTSGYDLDLENEAVAVKNAYGGNQAKQLLARHLYCLAQLILPAEYRFPNQPDPTTTITPLERARILAQWAVNVVDFRDPDSAMTRFAYDATPFEAKQINPAPQPATYWVPDDGVVFGVEQSDLVITETLAFHDLRIRNAPNPAPGTNPTEQLRVPQGSLFMEFLCPRVTTPMMDPTGSAGMMNFDGTLPPAMAGLYTMDGGELKLNLGAITPANSAGMTFPVWRVAFLKPEALSSTPPMDFRDPLTQVYEDETDPKKRFNYSYQVGNNTAGLKWHVGTETAPVADPKIDRVMWFANLQPVADAGTVIGNHALPGVTDPEDKIFRWTDGFNMIRGGQYLVVGPREKTYLGSKIQANPPAHMPSNHRFEFNAQWNWLNIWNQENQPAMWANPRAGAVPLPLIANGATIDPMLNAGFANKVRDCVAMTAGMPVPDMNSTTLDSSGNPVANDWESDTEITDKFIGLNVSEPTRDVYYIKPEYYLNSSDTTDPSDPENNALSFKSSSKDAYIDLATSPGTGSPPTPLDSDANIGYLSKNGWVPAGSKDYPEIKTEPNWTAAVLQRLADPARPYHEKYNPYITVDWMSIDLTVFSGEETLDPDGDIYLASRHKTGAMLLPNQPFARANSAGTNPPLAGNTFHSYHAELQKDPSQKVTPTAPVHFSYELPSEYYAATGATALPRSGIAEFSTLGYLNPQFVIRGTGPQQTLPLPATDDYEFGAYFLGAPGPNAWAVQEPADPTLTLKTPLAPYFPNREFVNAYELTSVPLSSPGQLFQEFSVQAKSATAPVFSHTLDFEDLYLQMHGTAFTPPASPPAGQERSSAILLECVDVPSPWVDSWKIVNPDSVKSGVSIAQTMLFENYRPPFNLIPTFREPGKINLNTITEPVVFRGLMWNIMTPYADRFNASAATPFKANLELERQGYGYITPSGAPLAIANPNPHLNQDSPTRFVRPFTSALAPDKFPDVAQKSVRSSDVGPMRRRLSDGKRLFDVGEPGVIPESTTPPIPTGWTYSTSIPLNSYIHNLPASRMANLTTDRSNVFAVRMTIAYFEYDPNPDPVTGIVPGLGAEYGTDQGRSKRHRAYYMIDRSIPVGYQMGYDMNIDNCVLLRSIIE